MLISNAYSAFLSPYSLNIVIHAVRRRLIDILVPDSSCQGRRIDERVHDSPTVCHPVRSFMTIYGQFIVGSVYLP